MWLLSECNVEHYWYSAQPLELSALFRINLLWTMWIQYNLSLQPPIQSPWVLTPTQKYDRLKQWATSVRILWYYHMLDRTPLSSPACGLPWGLGPPRRWWELLHPQTASGMSELERRHQRPPRFRPSQIYRPCGLILYYCRNFWVILKFVPNLSYLYTSSVNRNISEFWHFGGLWSRVQPSLE